MYVTIYPKVLEGEVSIPPSKSLTHRALICASLANGKSIIYNPLYCDDTNATINCLKNLGVDIEEFDDKIIIKGNGEYRIIGKLDAKDSASTIRFLIPLLSFYVDKFAFYGSERLLERMKTKDLLSLKGLYFRFFQDHIEVSGKLENNLKLFDNITSQFISGLLFLKPLTNLQFSYSQNSYLDLTIDIINKFLVDGKYTPQSITIESDFSSASFFIAMMLNNKIRINNLNFDSLQGDKKILSFLQKMGAKFIIANHTLKCLNGNTKGYNFNLENNPDLVPIIAAIASISNGKTIITGIEKLKYKESNRIKAIYEGLKLLGAEITFKNNSLIIEGKEYLEGNAIVNGYRDHRIIMSLVAISSKVKNSYTIIGYHEVKKSFPSFWELYQKVGGKYECKVSEPRS